MEQQTDITQKALGLEVYVVQNAQGQFFRAKGYGGSGKTWVDDINQANMMLNNFIKNNCGCSGTNYVLNFQ